MEKYMCLKINRENVDQWKYKKMMPGVVEQKIELQAKKALDVYTQRIIYS